MGFWSLPGSPTTGTPITVTWGANVNIDLDILQTQVGLYAKSNDAAGSPASTGQPNFLIQCGTDSVTFVSGFGAFTFPAAFPNSLIALTANCFSSSGTPFTVGWYSPSTSGVEFTISTGLSGPASISWIAIGS